MADEDPQNDSDDTPPERLAAPGAECRYHEGRPAVIHCPGCDRDVCIVCWHPALHRCQVCVLADPAGVAPGIPWETQGVGILSGFAGTLAQIASPTRTAPAMAGPGVRQALGFALLTWLPLSALQGVVPYTHTILFEPLSAALVGHPDTTTVVMDVARAAALGVLLGLVQLLGVGFAFSSLTVAYGGPTALRSTAWRGLLYRSLLLCALPIMSVSGAPQDLLYTIVMLSGFSSLDPTLAMLLYTFLAVAGGVLLLTTLRVVARLAQGTSALMAFVIPFIAVMVGVLARLLAEYAASPLMPHITSGG